MKKMATIFVILLLSAGSLFAQIPSLIEVSAEDMANYFSNDFSPCGMKFRKTNFMFDMMYL